MSNEANYKGFGTKAIHAGQQPDPHSGALMTPISMSSTFAQKNVGERYPGGYEYSRSGNPTRDVSQKVSRKYSILGIGKMYCKSRRR
jgi:cystathionine beta-lyase/cystathionine gamma-synthase